VGVRSLFHTLATLPHVSAEQKAGWAPQPVWTVWERQNPLFVQGLRPGPSNLQLVVILTTLFQLQ